MPNDDGRRLLRLAREARRSGWVVVRTGGDHLRWTSPAGVVVHTGTTPSDSHSLANDLAALRRAGLRQHRNDKPRGRRRKEERR